MKKISDETKNKILELRSEGLSYAQIVKAVGISRTSVIKIIKNNQVTDSPIEAKVKKPCPNPRLIIIYFNDVVEDDAKCVVRPGMNYPRGKTLLVRKVETSEEPLYRIV
jgi:intein-encoded DNA endonuclease-like protein